MDCAVTFSSGEIPSIVLIGQDPDLDCQLNRLIVEMLNVTNCVSDYTCI